MTAAHTSDRTPVITDLVLDTVEDLILLFETAEDGSHRCVTASGSWPRRVEQTQREVRGLRAEELLTRDGAARLAEAGAAAAISGAPAVYAETIDLRDGELPLEVTVKCASTSAGDDVGGYILWAGRDVTRQLHLERLAEEASLELARSNRALGAFTSAASHDMQEPLRMVAAYVELLDTRYGDQLDEQGRKYMAFAVDGAHRMQVMVDSLLVYGRVRSTPLNRQRVDVAAVAAAAIGDLGEMVREHGAAVEVTELPVVMGDATDLGRVLRNLLANALKFSTGERPTVRISSERGADHWVLHVDDDGTPIPEPDRERAFEMFTRLRRSAGPAGTGMGLALCREIVERHGGSIVAAESPLGGTRITFALPDNALEPT